MSNINDKAQVDLFVNGEQAEAAMKRLGEAADDLRKKIEEARAGGRTKEANKLQRQLERTEKELRRVESTAKGAGIVLNDLSNMSMWGLKNTLKYLQRERAATKPDSERWKQLATQIYEVKSRINELNPELEQSKGPWGKFKEWATGAWPALDLIRTWITDFIGGARALVDTYAGMEQELLPSSHGQSL